MNKTVKKGIIFILLALVAQPAYPALGNTASNWSNWALSGLYNGIKRHPWLTGTAVGITALVATGVYLVATLEMNDPDSTRRTKESLAKLTNIQREKKKNRSEWEKCQHELSSIYELLDLTDDSIRLLFDHKHELMRLQVKSTAERMNDRHKDLDSMDEDQLKEDIKIMKKQIKTANRLNEIRKSPENQKKINDYYKKQNKS